MARYRCKEGYTLSNFHGEETYRCKSNGQWSPSVPPVCISPSSHNSKNQRQNVFSVG